MLAAAASHSPLLLGKIVPSVGRVFLRHFHPPSEGKSVLRAVNRSLRDRSLVLHSKMEPRKIALIYLDNLKMSFDRSINPGIPILRRLMSSKPPDDKGERPVTNRIDPNKQRIDIEAWKTSSSKQSIIQAITSILKLVLGLVVDLVLMIFRLLRSLIGDKGKKVIDDATKTGAGAEIKKGVEKSKEIAARELPKLNEKLEKSIPIAKQNMTNFSSKVNQELSSNASGEEKFGRVMGMVGDLTKTSRPFQIFIAFLLTAFVFQVLKFLFWLLFGWRKCDCTKKDGKR
ncbi:unnamed protein product [Allacma fusca]|uniref:Uncharacterized protein n=1 Tax=Allacma fusca TaxID=39272 RepID=A0A8J2M8P1_9HEXA|nr:unnamed protein product [Allacma fusca]